MAYASDLSNKFLANTSSTHRARLFALQPLRQRHQSRTSRRVNLAVNASVAMAPEIVITKTDSIEKLKSTTAFNLDQFLAGKSKTWTFWDCDPSEFPWSYSKGGEDAYILDGQFYVTYEGGEAVEINAGDFVHFPAGQTHFKVTKPVRKFFTLLD